MTTTAQTSPDPRVLRRVLGAAVVGSSLEWYDFFLFSTASALVLGRLFFPTSDPAVGTLLALATFGVGFFARPVGSVIFGRLGDKLGRRPTLVATLLLMGFTTTVIGLLPTYATIGIWAPLSLVVLRLLQGLGAGAEHAGATIFAVEYAPPHRRGLFGGVPASGLYVGVVLSSTVYALFASMPEEQFLAWGWRVPFLLSFVLVAVGMYIRLKTEETPEFRQLDREDGDAPKAPLTRTFRDQWRSVLVIIGLVAGPFTATYAYQTYALSFLADRVGMTGLVGTYALTIAGLVAIAFTLASGALSDRWGRRTVIVLGGIVSGAFAFPFFWLLSIGSAAAVVLAMVGGVGIGVPLMLGCQGALFSELFSTDSRFTGFSVSRELGSILFAGMTPFAAAMLVEWADGRPWPVSVYVLAAVSLTVVTALVIREPAAREHLPGSQTDPRAGRAAASPAAVGPVLTDRRVVDPG
ncbi:MFS transporter [Amycolatopsis palatopharyngis]|uniref:MFS transporter n=1 Tax=Amycolatopsis palatopharyngis TaxID=187982 RepID=UPI000E26398F|nr:MFS transporter [Amycolatopsis palatopharyngis]